VCLAIPGQIVAWVDREHQIAKASVAGVTRNVNVGLLTGEDAVDTGDWVLIHVGFAMSKVDEAEARATREFLEQLGDPFHEELDDLRASRIE
jgi:hydrogenase expression/formation protein HypC